MKEKWEQVKSQMTSLWKNSSKKQKSFSFGIVALLLIGIVVITVMTSTSNYVPLYSNLPIEETGQIKEELDSRNIDYEITDGGQTIKVPEEDSEQLLVDLAGEDIPHGGHIDYSFFSENTSWGVTDNEFNMMKLDAMQTELANLMKGIDGIEDAKVMITLPEESVFVNEADETSSASIVVDTKYGYEFKDNQIKSLYNLVSQAVPDLPEENIVITNQYFEHFDLASNDNNLQGNYANQQEIKRDIEKDIQKRLQQMIGAMVGMQSVIVSVTADVDFTQENSTEDLVEPVDVDNMEGIPVSIETVQETFEGDQATAGGVVGTGEEDIPNYPAADGDGEGDYELVKETVNNEMNHIHNEIQQAPYKLRDLGIQVAVDERKQTEDNELQMLDQAEQNNVEEGINSILDSMITTSIDGEYGDEVDPVDNISIVFQSFDGQGTFPDEEPTSIPLWIYITSAVLILLIILLIVLMFRRRRIDEEESSEESTAVTTEEAEVPNIDAQPKSEIELQREQLEKMAKEKPDDFAKLLRSWISED